MHARVLAATFAALLLLPSLALADAGDLDTAFGSNGLTEVTIGAGDAFPAAILTSSGRVIVAGSASSAMVPGDIAIAQLNADGSPDTGYAGGDGSVDDPLPSGRAASVTGAVLQSDGKLVVVGDSTSGPSSTLFLARYTTTGALDTSFGGSNTGVVEDALAVGATTRSAAVTVTTDDKLLVAARLRPSGGKAQLAVASYTANGLTDSTFGTSGYRALDNADADHSTVPGGIALQSDGKIVVGGTSASTTESDFRIARLTTGGNVDTTFGAAGFANVDFGNTSDDLGSLVVRSDDKVMAGGAAGASSWATTRLTSDGALDSSFSGDGIAVNPEGDSGARINALAARGGRTFAGGYATQGTTTRGSVARYTSDGSLNSGWGTPERLLVFHAGKPTFVHALDTDPAHLLAAASAQGTDNRYRFGVAAFQYGTEPAAPSNDTPPQVNGTATVGTTLTVTDGAWTPGSGLTFSYRWQVCATAGATCASYTDTSDTDNQYTLAAGDAGKLVRARVTATGDGGSTAALSNVVGPVQSSGTPAVDIAQPAAGAQVALPTDTGQPSVVHLQGTADTGGSATVHVSLTSGGSEVSSKDVARDATTGAFSDDYAVPRTDAAYHLIVTHDTASDSVDFTTDASAPVLTITKPADGESPAGVRVDFAGTLGTAGGDQPTLTATLTGAASATLTPVVSGGNWTASRDLPEGNYTLTVKQADAAGHQTTVTRAFTVTYTVPVLTIGHQPEVFGGRAIDTTLTAETLTFGGTQPVTLTGQWNRCVSTTFDTTCTPIGGATGLSYHTTTADAGLYLRLIVTATNAKGSTTVEFKTAGPISRAGTGPVFVAKPKIDNASPGVGDTIATDGGQWTAANNQLSRVYQWQRCKTQNGQLACTNISGATESTYTVAAADGGYQLRVAVVAHDANGDSPVVYSDATQAVPAGCQAAVTFGPITATGCFRPEGATYVGTGNVSFNGLHLDPSTADAQIVIDPLNLRIATKGNAKIILGPANLPGGIGSLGPITLYEGHFNLVFQLNDQLKALGKLAAGVALPQLPGAPHLDLPNLSGVGNLAAGLPKIDGLGLPDFSKLSGDKLAALRAALPSWNLPQVAFPTNLIPNFALPKIGLAVPQLPGIGGFPLDGSVGLRAVNGGVAIDAALKIPAFNLGIPLPPVSANATVNVAANGTATLDNISSTVGTFNLGPLSVEDFNVKYTPSTDIWDGGATAVLQPIDKGLGGQFQFQHGKLAGGKITAVLGLPLGPTGLFLKSLGLGYTTVPRQIISGAASITAGPVIPIINVAAATLEGSAEYAFGTASEPGYLKFAGALSLAKQKVASGYIQHMDTGQLNFKGDVDLTVPGSGTPPLGVSGSLSGFFDNPFWEVDGNVDINAKLFGAGVNLNGQGRGSDVGLAGCASFDTPFGEGHTGGGYRWSTHAFEWFGGSCGIAAYKSAGARRSASLFQAGALTVTVPGGVDQRSFSITGTGAAPALELDAPDGSKITTPPAGYDGVQSGRFLMIRDPNTHTVNITAVKPPAGTWTIRPLPGSVAIAGVRTADPLPPVRIKAHVGGSGHRRKLVYALTPQAGMAVRFVEDSPNGQQLIGKAHGRRGSLRFSPDYGPAGNRKIEAIVDQDGMPRETDVVASYGAPGPAKLAAPRKLRLRRRQTTLTASWRPVKGATGFLVQLTRNGTTSSFDLVASKHGFSLPGVWASKPVKLTVRAFDPLHKPGAAAHRSLRAPKRLKPGHKKGGKKVKVKVK